LACFNALYNIFQLVKLVRPCILKFSNRSRIEWRYFEGNAKDRLRYRNESVWISQNTITDYQLTPFIEEEIFYDITDS